MKRIQNKNGTTVAINGDMLERIHNIRQNIIRYQSLEESKVIHQLIMEGMNRVHGDAENIDYIAVLEDLKRARKEKRRKKKRRTNSTIS